MNEKTGECYDCQYKKRKSEIGPNKKAFQEAMSANTVSIHPCSTCGENKGILPERDMDMAVKASNDQYISLAEWD